MSSRSSWLPFLLLLQTVASGGGSVAEEPTPLLERVGTIALKGPVGGLDHMALDSRRQRLLVANTANGSLDIVDLKAGKLLRQIPGQTRIRGVDYAEDLDQILVGNGTGGICNIFDAASYELVRQFALGENADNVRFHPRTRRAYVVHADQELAVIDIDTHSLAAPIALPPSLGALKIERSRPRLYVNAKAEGLVIAIDGEKGKVVDRFQVAPASYNASLAIDEARRRLFVGCRREPSLVVLDSETGRIVARVPIPGGVDDLWFDAHRNRIYASCGEGAIGVVGQVDADHYEALPAIPSARGARTSVLDPSTGRLYLGVPRHADRPDQSDPEIWVYEARP